MQFRRWANAINIQLEAIHGWKCIDYVLNQIKTSDDEIDAKVLERCLAEADVDIERDDVVDALGPSPVRTCLPKRRHLFLHLS